MTKELPLKLVVFGNVLFVMMIIKNVSNVKLELLMILIKRNVITVMLIHVLSLPSMLLMMETVFVLNVNLEPNY